MGSYLVSTTLSSQLYISTVRRMFGSTLTPVFVLLATASLVSGGFRCTLGQWACSASCVTLGQTSGICDGEGECNCSERSISLSDLRKLLPSRCNLVSHSVREPVTP